MEQVFRLFFLTLLLFPNSAFSSPDTNNGKYLSRIAGCYTCHTDFQSQGLPYAGGRKFKTPFGVFYSPNITVDKNYGIGLWSDKDFINAFRKGINPEGEHYFPAFPYTSFNLLTNKDLIDIKYFLFSLNPYPKESKNHELLPIIGLRSLQVFWKFLFFDEIVVNNDDELNRGKYLVDAALHCGECHTPKNFLGGKINSMYLSGTKKSFAGEKVPNITPDVPSGIGEWTEKEIIIFLQTLSLSLLSR